MRAFNCDRCGSLLFFENFLCVKCQSRLGFAPDLLDLLTIDPKGDHWGAVAQTAGQMLYRRCANDVAHSVCNWLIPASDPNELCVSCQRNNVIPDLTINGNLELWAKIEAAKRRLIYTLLRLHLFDGVYDKLKFSFAGGENIMTGHANGLITLNIAEADDVERERRRVSFHEPYRTLLGHFRHEIGHFYWERCISTEEQLNRFRTLFGDDTKIYADALKTYYANGPQPSWHLNFVSAYASSHPLEDWAETWAHYLHMIDAIETAASFGVSLKPKDHPDAKAMSAEPSKAIGEETPFEKILRNWLPLTYVLNTLNRGMGLPDLYPFVLSTTIIEKLRFVHDMIADARNIDIGKLAP